MSVLAIGTGCSTIDYYHQSISGHFSLLSKRVPIAGIVNDSTRDEKLIEQLLLAQQLRSFASSTLKLPDNNSYKSYVQLGRHYVTWNVYAAPEFSSRLQQWCFLVIGCLSYRGYFDEHDAQRYAAHLANQGLDVYIAGSPAYSTLGWFDDPLLSTMFNRGEIVTAAYIFHELAHQQVYVKGDSAFNEAFATTVEELGVRAWLHHHGRLAELNNYVVWLEQKTLFSTFIKNARQELKQLYAQGLTKQAMQTAKQNKIADIKHWFAELSDQNKQLSRYAKWMSAPLNNAQLGTIGLYRDAVPAFKRISAVCGHDFERFYKRIKEIGNLSHALRRQTLNSAPACQQPD